MIRLTLASKVTSCTLIAWSDASLCRTIQGSSPMLLDSRKTHHVVDHEGFDTVLDCHQRHDAGPGGWVFVYSARSVNYSELICEFSHESPSIVVDYLEYRKSCF